MGSVEQKASRSTTHLEHLSKASLMETFQKLPATAVSTTDPNWKSSLTEPVKDLRATTEVRIFFLPYFCPRFFLKKEIHRGKIFR